MQCLRFDLLSFEICAGIVEVENDTTLPQLANEELCTVSRNHLVEIWQLVKFDLFCDVESRAALLPRRRFGIDGDGVLWSRLPQAVESASFGRVGRLCYVESRSRLDSHWTTTGSVVGSQSRTGRRRW